MAFNSSVLGRPVKSNDLAQEDFNSGGVALCPQFVQSDPLLFGHQNLHIAGYWDSKLWACWSKTLYYWTDSGWAKGATSAHELVPDSIYFTGSGVFAGGADNPSKLYRSANGITDFTEILSWTSYSVASLGFSLCDLGSDKLLFINYEWYDFDTQLWYSVDGGLNWGNNAPGYDNGTALMTIPNPTGDPHFRHCHGMKYYSDHGKLLLFIGDASSESAIAVCDDVDDLVANPGTWEVHWGWDGANRTAASTPDSDYFITDGGSINSTDLRTLGTIRDGTTNYVYWGRDQATGDHGSNIHRSDLSDAAMTAELIVEDLVGAFWYPLYHEDEDMLSFMASSEVSGGAYLAGQDKYLRLYALTPDRTDVVTVLKLEQSGGDSPASSAVFARHFEAFGLTFLPWRTGYIGEGNAWTWMGRLSVAGQGTLSQYGEAQFNTVISPALALPIEYIMEDGKMYDSTPMARWGVSASSKSRDTTPVDGLAYSLGVTPTGDNAFAVYEFNDEELSKMAGRWVMIQIRVYMPSGMPAVAQAPAVYAYHGSQTLAGTSILAGSSSYWDGTWQTIELQGHFNPVATSGRLRLYANVGTHDASHKKINFSDIQIAVGPYPIDL